MWQSYTSAHTIRGDQLLTFRHCELTTDGVVRCYARRHRRHRSYCCYLLHVSSERQPSSSSHWRHQKVHTIPDSYRDQTPANMNEWLYMYIFGPVSLHSEDWSIVSANSLRGRSLPDASANQPSRSSVHPRSPAGIIGGTRYSNNNARNFLSIVTRCQRWCSTLWIPNPTHLWFPCMYSPSHPCIPSDTQHLIGSANRLDPSRTSLTRSARKDIMMSWQKSTVSQMRISYAHRCLAHCHSNGGSAGEEGAKEDDVTDTT